MKLVNVYLKVPLFENTQGQRDREIINICITTTCPGPWSSGYGKRLTSKGRGFEYRHRILDGHFFTYNCCKNCNVCLKRPKINEKEAGVGPFIYKKTFVLPQHVSLHHCIIVAVQRKLHIDLKRVRHFSVLLFLFFLLDFFVRRRQVGRYTIAANLFVSTVFIHSEKIFQQKMHLAQIKGRYF